MCNFVQCRYQYKIGRHLLYFPISIDYSRLSNLTYNDKEKNHVSNITNNNTDLEQAKNKNLYSVYNNYHL